MKNTPLVTIVIVITLILMYAFRYQVISDEHGAIMNRWTGTIYAVNGRIIGQTLNFPFAASPVRSKVTLGQRGPIPKSNPFDKFNSYKPVTKSNTGSFDDLISKSKVTKSDKKKASGYKTEDESDPTNEEVRAAYEKANNTAMKALKKMRIEPSPK